MAKIETEFPFNRFRGKVSSNERIVMRTRNGRTHSYVISKPYKGPVSENRRRTINRFSELVSLCKTEMSDPANLASWQDQYAKYVKLARKNVSRANARFIGITSDKLYSTLRGFIIASLSTRASSL